LYLILRDFKFEKSVCPRELKNMTVPPTSFWSRVYCHLNDVGVLSNTFANVLKSVIETH